MSQRIVVDPVTRIEGHLRIDCEVDGGRVKKAWSSGQMWRGIEVILQGRDPREAWLFTQRFCGVCTTVHAIASVRAVENAVGIQVPLNAQYIRNIILAAHAMHDHIVHFYHLSALDWVDVVSALQADPAATANLAQSLSDWPMNSVKEMTAVKARLAGFVEAGQLGPFANGYWGHPAMKLPPEVNLLAVSHYLQALDYQRKANQVVTILGSKTPNIQNLAVGGVANAINLDNESTLNMTKLYTIKSLLDEMVAFIQQVYLPDVCAIGALYADWLGYGSGVFEGIRAYPTDRGAAIFRLREHMERLEESARILMMDMPYSVDELCDATVELIRVNDMESGYIRPLIYLGYGEMGLNPLTAPVSAMVAAWPWGTYLGEILSTHNGMIGTQRGVDHIAIWETVARNLSAMGY